MRPTDYKFLQYPRGMNKGGVLDVELCPTISCSSWQNNCFLIEINMEEPKIIKEGNYSPSGHNASSVVNINGISPIVMENHGTITAIIEPFVINPIKGLSGKGWHFEQQVYDTKGITRAVKAGGGSGNIPKVVERRGQMCNTLDTGCQQSVVVPINSDSEGNCRTIKGQYYKNGRANFKEQGAHGATGVTDSRYRIRKLTPRECFRLMGVDDVDIDKIQAAGISNSQQYKMAGNSIVVDNLYNIFRTMFVDKPATKQVKQLTLF